MWWSDDPAERQHHRLTIRTIRFTGGLLFGKVPSCTPQAADCCHTHVLSQRSPAGDPWVLIGGLLTIGDVLFVSLVRGTPSTAGFIFRNGGKEKIKIVLLMRDESGTLRP